VVTATVDPMAGEVGTIYQACNFHYVGIMREMKERDGWIIDGKIYGGRSMRSKLGTQRLEVIQRYYPNVQKVKQSSKGRYFQFTSKKARKKHLPAIKHLLKAYPKRVDAGMSASLTLTKQATT